MGIETMAMLALGSAVVGGGLQIAGGAVGAQAALNKGEAEQFAYQAKAQAAQYNAEVASQRAASERESAVAMTSDYLRKGSAAFSSGVAARGATGVTEAGSPLMVDEATMREIALGASRTLDTGVRRARALEDEAALYTAEARNAPIAGQYARQGSYLAADASLLSGFAGAAGTAGSYFGYGARRT